MYKVDQLCTHYIDDPVLDAWYTIGPFSYSSKFSYYSATSIIQTLNYPD